MKRVGNPGCDRGIALCHLQATLSQQQGLATHANAFGMGLSTIAIAMGFMSETVLLNNQRKVLEGLKEYFN